MIRRSGIRILAPNPESKRAKRGAACSTKHNLLRMVGNALTLSCMHRSVVTGRLHAGVHLIVGGHLIEMLRHCWRRILTAGKQKHGQGKKKEKRKPRHVEPPYDCNVDRISGANTSSERN